MKIIEIANTPPEVGLLLDAVQDDEVLLVRDGHAVVRLEKLDDDDWADWRYEHSPEAVALGEHARQPYRQGKFRDLNQVRDGSSDADSP